MLALMRDEDIVAFTADHGNDPDDRRPPTMRGRTCRCWSSGPRVKPVALGSRATFADLGQTAAEYFGVPRLAAGTSFLRQVRGTE